VGPFTCRVKVPAGFKMPPHTHPNIELVTVLSGVFHFGMGKELDEMKVNPMPAGSFVVIPTDSPRYFVTKDETVLQVSGIGPWGITFVNPAEPGIDNPQGPVMLEYTLNTYGTSHHNR
jgi:Cupin domain